MTNSSLIPIRYPKTELSDNLTQKALAKRLRVNRSSVVRNIQKGTEHFSHWSSNYDPEGWSWERVVVDEKPVYKRKA